MLRSEDHSEEEGYEQEAKTSQDRENSFAASASVQSMGGSQDESKAKAPTQCVCDDACPL